MIRKILDTAVVDGKLISVKLITGKEYKFNYSELLRDLKKDLNVVDLDAKKKQLRMMGKIEAVMEMAVENHDEEYFKEKMREIYGK